MSDQEPTVDGGVAEEAAETAAESTPAAEAAAAPEPTPATEAAVAPEPTPAVEAAPAAEPLPAAEPAPSWEATLPGGNEALAERPEVLVGAAFAGGVVAAMILKRLVR